MATATKAPTTKGTAAPKPFVEKSTATTKGGKFAVTILVDENDVYGYRKNSRAKNTGQKCQFIDRIKDIFDDDYDRIWARWAVKAVELKDDVFDNAYEAL